MSIATKASNIPESKPPRTHYDRATLWRFHNSLYLGCVIGALAGFGYGQALLAWPKRAWQRASPRRTRWASSMMVARPDMYNVPMLGSGANTDSATGYEYVYYDAAMDNDHHAKLHKELVKRKPAAPRKRSKK